MADTKPDDEKNKTQAKEVAQPTPAATPKVADTSEPVKPVVALHRINGTILPGTAFRPSTAQDLADLETLGAVRDLTKPEKALFLETEKAATADADETLG